MREEFVLIFTSGPYQVLQLQIHKNPVFRQYDIPDGAEIRNQYSPFRKWCNLTQDEQVYN